MHKLSYPLRNLIVQIRQVQLAASLVMVLDTSRGSLPNGRTSWAYSFRLRSPFNIISPQYIILGAFTAAFSFVVYFFLADSPVKASFFTEEERIVAVSRVAKNKTGIGRQQYMIEVKSILTLSREQTIQMVSSAPCLTRSKDLYPVHPLLRCSNPQRSPHQFQIPSTPPFIYPPSPAHELYSDNPKHGLYHASNYSPRHSLRHDPRSFTHRRRIRRL